MAEATFQKSTAREYFESIVVAVILALFVRTFVFQAFKIATGSMKPNLLVGDHLLVNKFMFGPAASSFEKAILPMREVRRGDVGEVVVRGPMVMRGYWRQPETTQAAFHDGWLRTGDAGRMDESGHLFIVDRLKDMIISGGENVYGGEVETVLRGHPAVAQAAVVGVPDARWGEAVHAVVVLRPGSVPIESDVLRDWCRQRLAGYKCPRAFSFVPELPLSGAGKVMKCVLREQVRG